MKTKMMNAKRMQVLSILGSIALATVATSVLLTSACKAPTPVATPAAAISASATTATTTTVVAAPKANVAPKTFIGVLLPPQMADVSSRADGKLVAVPVKVGQLVHKGDVLAVFDARERKQELAMANGQLKAAQGMAAAAGAELGAARSRAARRNAAVDVGGRKIAIVSAEEASQSVFESHGAAGRAASASGSVAEQKARIGALQIALEETELRAPFDGVVTGSYFEAGMNVHAKETVVRVVGGGKGLRVRMALPEDESASAKMGKTARLALDDGTFLTAHLARVSPEVDSATRSFFVEAEVDLAADGAADDAKTLALAGRTVRATITP